MLKPRSALRESLAKFTKDVENNGIRGAILNRRPTFTGNDSASTGLDMNTASDDAAVAISSYTLGDHMEYLHIHKDAGGHRYVDVSHLLSDSVGIVKDFCSPIPKHRLEQLYHGINETKDELKQVSLPVRTMTMRLAPHVMPSVILDAVQDACQHQSQWTPQVLKRLLGHFQCLLVPCTDDADDAEIIEKTAIPVAIKQPRVVAPRKTKVPKKIKQQTSSTTTKNTGTTMGRMTMCL